MICNPVVIKSGGGKEYQLNYIIEPPIDESNSVLPSKASPGEYMSLVVCSLMSDVEVALTAVTSGMSIPFEMTVKQASVTTLYIYFVVPADNVNIKVSLSIVDPGDPT